MGGIFFLRIIPPAVSKNFSDRRKWNSLVVVLLFPGIGALMHRDEIPFGGEARRSGRATDRVGPVANSGPDAVDSLDRLGVEQESHRGLVRVM